MIVTDSPLVERSAFENRTGWVFKPEGACKGDRCIPLAEAPGATLDAAEMAATLHLPVVHDEERSVWAIGPESIGGRALTDVVAPNLTLPDLDGRVFELDSLRGTKVLLVAWAPY